MQSAASSIASTTLCRICSYCCRSSSRTSELHRTATCLRICSTELPQKSRSARVLHACHAIGTRTCTPRLRLALLCLWQCRKHRLQARQEDALTDSRLCASLGTDLDGRGKCGDRGLAGTGMRSEQWHSVRHGATKRFRRRKTQALLQHSTAESKAPSLASSPM